MTTKPPDFTAQSPCIGWCRIDPDSGYCGGCWRALEEIGAWPRLDGAARAEIWAQLVERRDKSDGKG